MSNPDSAEDPAFAFDAVPLRARHDGWTPDKQTGFIEALAESACVDHACRRVGMSPASAYALRRRVDAQSFRIAWDAALDYGVRRLGDAVFSRALSGVARPVFYKGEQIGERRYFDERLAMFVLRYRDPVRYGAWLDKVEFSRASDGAAIVLAHAAARVAEDARIAEAGLPPLKRAPLETTLDADSGDEDAAEAARARRADEARARAKWRAEARRHLDRLKAENAAFDAQLMGDVASTSSTSAPPSGAGPPPAPADDAA